MKQQSVKANPDMELSNQISHCESIHWEVEMKKEEKLTKTLWELGPLSNGKQARFADYVSGVLVV